MKKNLLQAVIFSALALISEIGVMGADYFGAQFSDTEMKQWHGEIAMRYGIAAQKLVVYGKDTVPIRGEVLAVLDTGTLLIQPANGEPMALTAEGDISKPGTGRPLSRLGLRKGEREYASANGTKRLAPNYLEIRKLDFSSFVDSLSREPQHAAFDGMRAVAMSRQMTIRAAVDLKKQEAIRAQKTSDPAWQAKHLMKRGDNSPASPKTPIVKNPQTLK